MLNLRNADSKQAKAWLKFGARKVQAPPPRDIHVPEVQKETITAQVEVRPGGTIIERYRPKA